MEQVRNDLNVATITEKKTARTKNYQKYFDVATQVKVNKQVKVVAYSRAKVVLVTAYCVLTLLLALAIANFVLMSSIASNIEASKVTYQNEIAVSEYYSNEIEKAQDGALSRLIDAGFLEGEIQMVDVAPIEIPTETNEIQEQTNWFNEFTKFISKVFGG